MGMTVVCKIMVKLHMVIVLQAGDNIFQGQTVYDDRLIASA